MIRTASPTRPRSIDELLSPAMVARISALDYTSKKIFAGKLKGERRSKRRGQSVEFADHRAYVRGDDTRHIDWSIYARLDRLFLKLFLEEEDLALHVVLDCSASHDCGNPNKFLYMQQVAMTLGYIGLVNYNRVTISAIGGGRSDEGTQARRHEEEAGDAAPLRRSVTPSLLSSIRDLRGRRRTRDLAAFLCGLEPSGPSPWTEGCKRIALSRRGKGVMVVLSDFFIKEGYESGLRLLLGRGYDVFAVQVLSPQEIEPAGDAASRGRAGMSGGGGGDTLAGDLRLRDIEDADVAEVTISQPLLKRYKATLAAYNDQLRMFCARRDISLASVRSDTPIETLILDHLRKRGLLR
jgi:uncharacterized protein (DUF58 family)